MLDAATGWQSLAGQSSSTAIAYQSVISELITGSWNGVAASWLCAAAAPAATWTNMTAKPAEATAYETEFADRTAHRDSGKPGHAGLAGGHQRPWTKRLRRTRARGTPPSPMATAAGPYERLIYRYGYKEEKSWPSVAVKNATASTARPTTVSVRTPDPVQNGPDV